MFDRTIRIWPW